ncbi:DUF2306 domain-containing protein [Kiloniella antarctica]|uniref:DUF2306 domain-containing protein n=1 Tax=Kiloniella antarctica TaxID=1550907 RepID=A0ABW5BMQ9_9PROT
MKIKSVAKKGFWLLLMLSATGIALLSTRFLLPDPPHVGPDIIDNFMDHKPAFLTHVLGSLIALLIGPWQFVSTIRRRWPQLHRWMGRIYMIAVLLGGIGGFIVAWTTSSGPVAVAGFALLSVIWLFVTGKGYQSVRAGRYAEHRMWMIRSFALTAAAITLRLGLPIAPAMGVEFQTGYIAMSWLSWLLNLTLAEIYLRSGRNDQAVSNRAVV